MSRPRREWWSFLCSRRCSVSSLMRAVSSATWTSGDPVSLSPRPNLWITSCFASLVSGTAENVAGSLGGLGAAAHNLERLLHVPSHLGRKVLRGVEALLVAQPGDEGESHRAAVEVSVEADQVRLHPLLPGILERGPDPDADRRG